MKYTLTEIKLAAYNWIELQDMDQNDRNLWMGLGYCYEWFRSHPEDKGSCDELAKNYIEWWEKNK